jgi:sulfite reductase alpha subunit-like flavoprotein/ankyrin repeat protein
VAEKMGVSCSDGFGNLWKDRAALVINEAVLYSFQSCGLGIVEHQTLLHQFWDWYNLELKSRGYCPGNWKWIIPPFGASLSPCYLQLNKMTEYTLRPIYKPGLGYNHYLARWKAKSADPADPVPTKGPSSAKTRWQLINKTNVRGAMRLLTQGKISVLGVTGMHGDSPVETKKLDVLVLYATVSGNTKNYAKKLKDLLERADLKCTFYDVEMWDPDDTPRYNLLFFLTCTYGCGDPPASATRMIQWLSSPKEEVMRLTHMSYSVFGLGSRHYRRFAAAADLMDQLMTTNGAQRLADVQKADGQRGGMLTFTNWVREVFKGLSQMPDISPILAHKLTSSLGQLKSGGGNQFNGTFKMNIVALKGHPPVEHPPVFRSEQAEIKSRTELMKGKAIEEGQSTQLVVLSLPKHMHRSYHTGDHLRFYACNEFAPAVMERFAGYFDYNLDHYIHLEFTDARLKMDCPYATPTTLRHAMMTFFCLRRAPSMEACGVFAYFAKQQQPSHSGVQKPPSSLTRMRSSEDASDGQGSFGPPQESFSGNPGTGRRGENLMYDYMLLRSLSANASKHDTWSHTARWIDIFDLFPALQHTLPLEVLFEYCEPMQPRHYSISSSSSKHPDELHVTVRRLQYQKDGATQYGLASKCLTSMAPGSKVSFVPIVNPLFHHPWDTMTPIIMIGAGTGIAPFRGFWQERMVMVEHGEKMGECVLLFGCQRRDTDFLFEDEINAAVEAGAITHFLPALSQQPGIPKTYVQDLILQNKEIFEEVLGNPTCEIFVCGHSRMLEAVSAAMTEIIGFDVMSRIVSSGRFHEDVFGFEAKSEEEQNQGDMLADMRMEVAALQTVLEEDEEKFQEYILHRGQDLEGNTARLQSLHSLNDLEDTNGNGLLHMAALLNKPKAIRFLVDQGMTPNAMNSWGLTPLAVANASPTPVPEAVECLQRLGAPLCTGLHSGFYPVHTCILTCDLTKELERVLGEVKHVDDRDFNGCTPLHLATRMNKARFVRVLLEHGADPNAQDRMGRLVLHAGNHLPPTSMLITLLLRHGGKVISDTPSVQLFSHSHTTAKSVGITQEQLDYTQSVFKKMFNGASRETMETYGVTIFGQLFELSPHLLNFFPFKNPDGTLDEAQLKIHARKVLGTFQMVMNLFGSLEILENQLTQLIRKHVSYGVQQHHYGILVAAIIRAVSMVMGDDFTSELEGSLNTVLGVLPTVAEKVYAEMEAEKLAEQ